MAEVSRPANAPALEQGSSRPLGDEDGHPVASGPQVVSPKHDGMLGSIQKVGALERVAPEVFFALDGQLRYVYWSRAAEDLTGIPSADAVGRSFYEVFPEAVGTPAEGLYLDVLRTRQPGGFTTEWEGTAYGVAAYPASEGLAVFAGEILDRQQGGDKALPEEPKRFWAFFDELPVAAAIVSEGRITRANDSFLAMFGYLDRSGIECMSLAGHFDPSSRARVGELLRGLLTDGSPPGRCGATARGSDGATFSVWVTGRCVETPGGPALACFLLEA